MVKLFASSLLTVASNPSVSDQILEAIKTLLSILRERHSTVVDSAYLDVSSRLAVPVDLLNTSGESGALVSIYSADTSARVQGIKDLFSDLTLEDSDRETAKEAIRARLADHDPAILDAIYEQTERLGELLTSEEVVDALCPVFVGNQVKAQVLSRHVKFLCRSLVVRQPELEGRVFQQLLFHVMLPSSERRGLSKADWESIAAVPAKGSDILRKVAQDITKAEIGALDKDTAPEVYRIMADSLSSMSPHPVVSLGC
jgi:U3 small nucleolar RNA-associated protein 10